MVRAVPNTLTLCNLIAGSAAIAALFQGKPVFSLILAMVGLTMDLLDGYLARRLKVSSALGVQLDSLADLVTFGVLPGCILFLLLQDVTPATTVDWLPYTAFLFTAGVALRLAKFNTDTRDKTVFHGLPTPSAATFVFGLLWMSLDYHVWWSVINSPVVLGLLILLLPLLMLSDLRLWSIKGLHHQNGRVILAAFLVLFVLLLLFAGSAAISLLVVIYLLFGIANHYLKLY